MVEMSPDEGSGGGPVSRRDAGPVWKKYYRWPDSYARFIHYIFSRYQAYNVLLSPIHFDWSSQTGRIPWNKHLWTWYIQVRVPVYRRCREGIAVSTPLLDRSLGSSKQRRHHGRQNRNAEFRQSSFLRLSQLSALVAKSEVALLHRLNEIPASG